jgi:hypothetical protein
MKCDNKELVYMDDLDSSRKYLLYHRRYGVVIQLVFLMGHLYLIGVCLGEVPRTNTIQLGGPVYLVKESNKHALLITTTKLGEVQFWLKHCCRFANATKVLLWKSNR